MSTFERLFTSPEALATILSVAVALILGVIGVLRQRAIHKREYTLQVISHSLTNPRITAGKNILRRLHAKGQIFDPNQLCEDDVDKVSEMLGYFEFMANAYLRGDLDKTTIREQMEGSFILNFETTKDYIHRRRDARGRPKTFIGIEILAKRFARRA